MFSCHFLLLWQLENQLGGAITATNCCFHIPWEHGKQSCRPNRVTCGSHRRRVQSVAAALLICCGCHAELATWRRVDRETLPFTWWVFHVCSIFYVHATVWCRYDYSQVIFSSICVGNRALVLEKIGKTLPLCCPRRPCGSSNLLTSLTYI